MTRILLLIALVGCGGSSRDGDGGNPGGGGDDMANGAWQPAAIRFDDLQFQDVVSNQYPLATFSTVAGSKVNVSDYTWDALSPHVSSTPNMICVGVLAGGGCNKDLYVDFTKPVRKLRFIGVGVNNSGTVAVAHLFAGQTELGSE